EKPAEKHDPDQQADDPGAVRRGNDKLLELLAKDSPDIGKHRYASWLSSRMRVRKTSSRLADPLRISSTCAPAVTIAVTSGPTSICSCRSRRRRPFVTSTAATSGRDRSMASTSSVKPLPVIS